ncbi:hypothetical protein XENOCAPTIV_015494 [Xenoophorus captivus]|uniref:Protein kinase domain-containing protein n=1 Tax=Xenoophorus captivus TaxID=1517983 RepID=A0ABV0RSM9_9TELE
MEVVRRSIRKFEEKHYAMMKQRNIIGQVCHTPKSDGMYVGLRKEEMYIFMEYCDEGTLEEVSRLGLQEHVIRLYSKQITTAINVLHEHGIVHRDIKG